jgi:transposase
VQIQVDENDLARANEAKVARGKSGLYWGTYLHTEQSFEKAKHSHTDPGFKHFNGDGHLAVQIQKGMSSGDVFGEGGYVRIDAVPDEAWSSPIRGERRRLSKTRLWFRVGSEGRKPVWAVFPMTMHRPLPPESRIKWVHLIRERIGTQYRYSVNFAVEYPSEPVIETGEGTVAIDIGWRLMEDGLRVAYWYDSQGKEGELKLPLRILTALQKCDDIRSIRDDNFNKTKAELCGLLPWMELPEWFQKDTATLHLWRSTGRLAALALKWRDNRFDGDAEAYETMGAWRKRDKHLLDYEANLRDKTLTHRREIYRVFASELREKYDTVILEAFDLRDIAEQPEPEEGPKEHTGSRTRRPIAALSQLRQSIKDSGLRIVEVSPKNTSRRCHVCGHIEVGFTEVQHQCSNCGSVWDRDSNAAINILRSGSKHLEPEQTSERIAC